MNTGNETDEIFIDLRSEIDKANVRLSRHIHTFRRAPCNIWNDRPHLVSFEICKESSW